MVEVWLLRDGAERFDHGPVRFFYRHQGRWHLSVEMSEWSEETCCKVRR
jgi:hypothetical protein